MASSNFSPRDFFLGFIAAFVVSPLLVGIVYVVFLRNTDVYGLGHWKLNIRAPLTSMWMNLGFWKHPDGTPVLYFDEACFSLLKKVVETSGILNPGSNVQDQSKSTNKSLAVVDLGFGCGDQTWALAKLAQNAGYQDFRYVGLTLNDAQMQTASRKIQRELASCPGLDSNAFKLFRADAAQPKSWNPAVRSALEAVGDEKFDERWFLALDCLYHFSPSRAPVFEFAARKLSANFMAFDLVLNEKASRWDTFLIRVVSLVMACPLHTFLTEDEYRRQLIECGYDSDSVIVKDISQDVFPGVAEYLQRQERGLELYGISIGGFKLAGRLFGWFGRSKVVRACVVVGRTKGRPA